MEAWASASLVWTDEVVLSGSLGVLEASVSASLVWTDELVSSGSLVFWKRGSASLVWTDELVLSASLVLWKRVLRQVWFGRMSWF